MRERNPNSLPLLSYCSLSRSWSSRRTPRGGLAIRAQARGGWPEFAKEGRIDDEASARARRPSIRSQNRNEAIEVGGTCVNSMVAENEAREVGGSYVNVYLQDLMCVIFRSKAPIKDKEYADDEQIPHRLLPGKNTNLCSGTGLTNTLRVFCEEGHD